MRGGAKTPGPGKTTGRPKLGKLKKMITIRPDLVEKMAGENRSAIIEKALDKYFKGDGMELIKTYIRENYNYEGIEDPTEYPGLDIRLIDDLEANVSSNDYDGLMMSGDYLLVDERCAEIVRIIDGKVKQIWLNI